MIRILIYAFNIYNALILVNILLSWAPELKRSSIGVFIDSLVEPYVAIFRSRYLRIGMFDFSYIAAIVVLNFATRYAITLL